MPFEGLYLDCVPEITMAKRFSSRLGLAAGLTVLVGLIPGVSGAQPDAPIVYTVKFPSPEKHVAEIEAVVPTGKAPAIEMMMAVWSPGFYRVQDYAKQVENLSARSPDGATLEVEHTQKNRWRIQAGGAPKLVLSYRLTCKQVSVTTNYVGDELAVLNGAATFITPVEQARRAHEVRLMLPEKWKRSATALPPAPDRLPNHYRAPDYDTLVDSPIVAGNPVVHEFVVEGSKHFLVDLGDLGSWDGEKAAQVLEKIVRETRRFWGFLPYDAYYFLNVFRTGAGGLEHKNSTLLTANPGRTPGVQASFRWLSFVSHEYFHAFNVKRLRPVELGPFDYENPPHTKSLWISEGLTTYFGDLIVVRAGLATPDQFLAAMSSSINQLQTSPGRLAQSLEDSSLDVWGSGTSGVGRNRTTQVSYYVKGPIVGLLLDARIRRATSDRKNMDDVMRLAYQRYAGERGFTAEQFRATAEQVAGADLKDWFKKALSSTEELDYSEALDWYGLRFAPPEEPQPKDEPAGKDQTSKKEAPAKKDEPGRKWKLEVRADASDAQKSRLGRLLQPSRGR
jgi:predicted metalloprotease with PDZ domain